MKPRLLSLILGIMIIPTSLMNASETYLIPSVNYPITKKGTTTDDYFGTIVADPYRWLEIDTADDVKEWVKEQNKVTSAFLSEIPFRDTLRGQIERLFNYEKVTAPIMAGEYVFYSKNNGLQNQAVIYRRHIKTGTEQTFIDPNSLSKDGTTAIALVGVSQDNKYVAYTQSVAGSDWSNIRIKEVATAKDLKDDIRWTKFSDAVWYQNGFFYSRFPETGKGRALTALNEYQQVFYHTLGTPQEQDKLIYEDKRNPRRYKNITISEDEKYAILYIAEGTDGFETWYKPLDLSQGNFRPLTTGFKHKTTVIDHHNGTFYALTDIDAPNYRLVAINPNKPDTSNWIDIIPESDDLLENVSAIGGKLIATYIKDVSSRVYQFSYSGTKEREITLPGLGTAIIESGKKFDNDLYYSFTSFTQPVSLFKYNIPKGTNETFYQPKLNFNISDFDCKQIFYASNDGSKIPMFIISKKGVKRDGSNPTLLYGYGGFNISLMPKFSAAIISFIEYGGIYAIANIRGGNEYGERWHKAGMLLNKQNVFDDFTSAARYLINEGYTSSAKLGISGGSNGGLLVGACMTQHPELFKVAFPAVGVLDMLRYHKFTVGFGWIPEYGSSEDTIPFSNLIKYSPLHNLKIGTEYPATMITTGDHDDRVVPAHSFKFAATLQEKHAGKNPVLIRIDVEAGHGAGKPTSKQIDEVADKWAFFFFNTQSKIDNKKP